MKTWIRTLSLCTWTLMLAACGGGLHRGDRPAQVEERTTVPVAPDSGPGTQVAAYTPPAPPRVARPAPKRAVAVLMRRAEDQRRTGELDAAVVSLERALRISPNDPVLWHRLADVRLSQQQYALVTQLAAKSNALSSASHVGLRADNWMLIARARKAQGDSGGARAAERKAATLR